LDVPSNRVTQGADFVDAARDPFGTKDLVDARLLPDVEQHAPHLTRPSTDRGHHAREPLWTHDDYGDGADQHQLCEGNTKHLAKLARGFGLSNPRHGYAPDGSRVGAYLDTAARAPEPHDASPIRPCSVGVEPLPRRARRCG